MEPTATEPQCARAPGTDYAARARDIGPAITAAADEIERRRELPDALVRTLVEAGLFRLLLPRAFGGAELPPAQFAAFIEEIAKYDASTAWCLGQANGCAMTAAYLDAEAAREIFGGPDGIVAWGPPGSPAELRPVAGGYRLTGSWSFASGSHHAGWLGAHLAAADEAGRPRLRADGGTVLRTLLFPKASARMIDSWDVIGLSGTGSDTFSVEDLFVPERHTVLRDGTTQPRQGGRLYRFSSSNLYASGFAGVALGIARATLDAFIELARDKIPRGQRRTLRDNNVVQSQVAQAEAKWRSAREFLLGSLEAIWHQVGRTGGLSLDQHATIRLASTWAIHQSAAVVDTAYHAAGASAIFRDNPFERRLRDMHTVIQQYQGRQAHFETVGQVLLGLPPDSTMFTF
jgi:alkylation response protein AidB-like acyl-CoA dehydrogenase